MLSLIGISLALISGFAYMFRNMMSKKLSAKGFKPRELSAIQNSFGAVIFFILLILSGDLGQIYKVENMPRFLILVAFIAFLSLIAGALQYYIYNKVEYTKASLGFALMPIFSSIFAFILLGEVLSFINIVGIVITTFGLVILYSTKLDISRIKEDPYKELVGKTIQNKYFWLLIINVILFSIVMVGQKQILNESSPLIAFFLLYFFVSIYNIKPAIKILSKRNKVIPNLHMIAFFAVIASIAFGMGLLSYQYLPLGVADAFRGLTMPITILIGSIAFNENAKLKTKFTSSVIITSGIVILSLF